MKYTINQLRAVKGIGEKTIRRIVEQYSRDDELGSPIAPAPSRLDYHNNVLSLYYGDCLERMRGIPDNSVDMVLSDPPYQTTALKWDSHIPFEPMWAQIKRVVKDDSAIVMTSSQPFTTRLIASNEYAFRYCWVWDKHIPRGMSQARNQPMRKHEDVCVFSYTYPFKYYPIKTKREKPVTVKNYQKEKGGFHGSYKDNTKTYTYTHKNPTTIITGCWEANAGKIHPTQKPVSLGQYLIKTYTQAGDTVLDFAMGSGSFGVAAKMESRKFIGIELNEDYYVAARDRIVGCLS